MDLQKSNPLLIRRTCIYCSCVSVGNDQYIFGLFLGTPFNNDSTKEVISRYI